MMDALTLWQPYAWAIPHGKTVENRDWFPPVRLLGEQIAIAAAKDKLQGEELQRIADIIGEQVLAPPPALDEFPSGAITSVARLVGWTWVDHRGRPRVVAEPEQAINLWHEVSTSPHYCEASAVQFVLHDGIELPRPIPCRGRQRFWRLNRFELQAVMHQLRLLQQGTNLICSLCCGAGELPLTADQLIMSRCPPCGGTGIQPTTQAKGA